MRNQRYSTAYRPDGKDPFHSATPQRPRPARVAAKETASIPPNKAPLQALTASVSAAPGRSVPRDPLTQDRRRLELTRGATSALISLIVHTALFVLLLSLAMGISGGSLASLSIEGSVAKTESEGMLELSLDDPKASVDSLEPTEQSASISESTASSTQGSLTADQDQAVAQVGLGPPAASTIGSEIEFLTGSGAESLLTPSGPLFGEYSVQGRSPSQRGELARANGGSPETEAAVEAALRWLAIHQYSDGGWSTVWSTPTTAHPACMGQCLHDSKEQFQPKRTAATGLALLAFLGAGYTHREGKYREEVYAALHFLMDTMQYDKRSKEDQRSPGQWVDDLSKYRAYEQGIATFALCEAYHMTGDESLREACQVAVNYVCGSQSYDGSWGYYPGQPGDLSINGWQMLALRSAAAGGLTVSPSVVKRTDRFLKSQAHEGGSFYTYRGESPLPEMTAIGALMRLMRGTSRTDPRIAAAINYVAFRSPGPMDDGPELTDVYFNYYATNLLFYAQSTHWPQWNERMKVIYLNSQATEGHEAGSWFKSDKNGVGFTSQASDNGLNAIGGRLYTTAMAAMTLEVYYRYLPILKSPDQIDFKL